MHVVCKLLFIGSFVKHTTLNPNDYTTEYSGTIHIVDHSGRIHIVDSIKLNEVRNPKDDGKMSTDTRKIAWNPREIPAMLLQYLHIL